VRIDFAIGEGSAEFFRDDFTGRAEVRHEDEVVRLASPFNPLTHVSLSTTHEWQCQIQGHDVAIVKVRPRMAGGLRANEYVISVDGVVVAEDRGK